MPRLTKAERELRDTIAACTTLEHSRNAWRNKADELEKRIVQQDQSIAQWGRSHIDNQRVIGRLGDEIDRHKVTINDLHARIGRMCIGKGLVP